MNTFKKEERLCSKRLLDLLFKNGSSFLFYPFRVTFLRVAEPSVYPAQLVINVAKKRYKHAVDRNLIKRRTREAYRLQKNELLYSQMDLEGQMLIFGIQYVGKKIYPYSFFEKKLAATLKKLVEQLKPNEETR